MDSEEKSSQNGKSTPRRVLRTAGTGKERVLLIGEVQGVLPAGIEVEKFGCAVCENVLDAVSLAAKEEFSSIAVVISSVESKLGSSIKALRAVSGRARIILLARMWEEPFARELVCSKYDGARLVDDYLICPVTAREFQRLILGQGDGAFAAGALESEVEKQTAVIKHLARLAMEDDLTGLRNRRYVREFLRQIIERAKKERLKVTVLIFDIDDFKQYNDVYGHSAGDMILKQAGILMQRCCRGHDVVGRIGGDEFAVIFWDGPKKRAASGASMDGERRSAIGEHPREAMFIAERFRRELGSAELALLGPKGKGVLTISGGLASFPHDGQTGEQLLWQADNALLEAKRSGKNRIYLVGEPHGNS